LGGADWGEARRAEAHADNEANTKIAEIAPRSRIDQQSVTKSRDF
jgi:hypothetical protein